MDKNDQSPIAMSNIEPGITDPVILGLERKLEVLRAQLAASRAGEDPGDVGVITWSRLEEQSQRIQRLMRDNDMIATERDDALAQMASGDRNAADRERKLNSLRREAAVTLTELERARAEILTSQRTNIALGRAINIALASNVDARPSTAGEMAPAEMVKARTDCAEALMLAAMLNSTSWRITAPLRAFGTALKLLRRAVRN